MKTRSTPTFSFISLMIGADALAVFDPREIIDLEKSISSSFAPGTNISISSLSFGVEAIIIFLAPFSKCFWASSEPCCLPVAKTTISVSIDSQLESSASFQLLKVVSLLFTEIPFSVLLISASSGP